VFGLVLSSLWLGLTTALFERLLRPATPFQPPTVLSAALASLQSLARPALFNLVLCTLLLVLLPNPLAERHAVLALVLLLLGSLVGSGLGLVISRLAEAPLHGLAVSVFLCAGLGLYGGFVRPLPSLGMVERCVAAFDPARWSFEALSLGAVGDSQGGRPDDPVGAYFPADTERAGVSACVTVLLAMIGGLVYADAFLALTLTPRGQRSRAGT
jgi:hypothetical protein